MRKEIGNQKIIIKKLSEKLEALITTKREMLEKKKILTEETSVIETEVETIHFTINSKPNQIFKASEFETIVKKERSPKIKKERKAIIKNENWVGVNLLNRIGAILIIIGTIATAAFDGFHPTFRTIIIFLFAFSVIGLGIFLNRKKSDTFSIGVSATGVALVYVAIAVSFFGLETLNMYVALICSIVTTIFSVFLATKYKAQVIGCFAIIGGYLPIFALHEAINPLLISLIIYFLILAAFSLIIALSRKWSIMNLIGLGLTIAATIYLGFIIQANASITLYYACFAFFLYTALPLIASYRTKEEISKLDLSIVITNTLVSSIVIFLIASKLDDNNLQAILSLLFAIIYASLAFFAKRLFANKDLQILFSLTSITFCVLFVPFFFDKEWFAIAWLFQSVLLAAFGILRNRRGVEYIGIAILGLSGVSLAINHFIIWSQFTLNYFLFTMAILIILSCYILKGRTNKGYEQGYKFLVFTNLWIFLLYLIFRYTVRFFHNPVAVDYIVSILFIVITFGLAFLYAKVKIWSDIATKKLANLLHFIGLTGLWVITIIVTELDRNMHSGLLAVSLFAAIIATLMIIYDNLPAKKFEWMTENLNPLNASQAIKIDWLLIYKNLNLINLWLISLVIFGWFMDSLNFFGTQMFLILITFAFAFAIKRFFEIYDKRVRKIAICINIIGIIWLSVFNAFPYSNVLGLMILNAITLILALFAINETVDLLDGKKEYEPLKIVIISSYFLFIVTQLMIVQANVAFSSAIISLIYAGIAFIWIVAGFRLKNKPVRKAGLFLSMASVAKLLIVDTWGLSTEMRTISYISLGLILMLISFIYQKLNKELAEQ
ncbi:MAG: DUF2339 domain-containing protein [Erysipelotrichales bacterium]|nr:DUF2339 domain-containing protein [Erysipelotrichales bacterium]